MSGATPEVSLRAFTRNCLDKSAPRFPLGDMFRGVHSRSCVKAFLGSTARHTRSGLGLMARMVVARGRGAPTQSVT